MELPNLELGFERKPEPKVKSRGKVGMPPQEEEEFQEYLVLNLAQNSEKPLAKKPEEFASFRRRNLVLLQINMLVKVRERDFLK